MDNSVFEIIMTKSFWEINFLGIVGSFTGVFSLIISWRVWCYSKPAIEISKVKLKLPKTELYINKDEKHFNTCPIIYELDVRITNKKGGSGSIEKPILKIRYQFKRTLGIFKQHIYFSVEPITQHNEWRTESSGYTYGHIIREGEAWNLKGGEIKDDEIRYVAYGKNLGGFYEAFQDSDHLDYFIEYQNNFGSTSKLKINDFCS